MEQSVTEALKISTSSHMSKKILLEKCKDIPGIYYQSLFFNVADSYLLVIPDSQSSF